MGFTFGHLFPPVAAHLPPEGLSTLIANFQGWRRMGELGKPCSTPFMKFRIPPLFLRQVKRRQVQDKLRFISIITCLPPLGSFADFQHCSWLPLVNRQHIPIYVYWKMSHFIKWRLLVRLCTSASLTHQVAYIILPTPTRCSVLSAGPAAFQFIILDIFWI